MRKLILASAAVAALTGLAACTTAQVQTTTAAVNTACQEALASASLAQGSLKGGALNTANSIATYVTAGCAGEQAIAAIANDPSTLAWLGQLKGQLDALKATQAAAPNAPAVSVAGQ
jgi:hypothetical protein